MMLQRAGSFSSGTPTSIKLLRAAASTSGEKSLGNWRTKYSPVRSYCPFSIKNLNPSSVLFDKAHFFEYGFYRTIVIDFFPNAMCPYFTTCRIRFQNFIGMHNFVECSFQFSFA